MIVFEKGLITIICCDVVFALIAIPLMLRKVPPNIIYGYRTRATLTNASVWYDANAHLGRGLLIASVVSLLAISVFYGTRLFSPQTFLMASMIALVVPAAFAGLATARHVRSLTRR